MTRAGEHDPDSILSAFGRILASDPWRAASAWRRLRGLLTIADFRERATEVVERRISAGNFLGVQEAFQSLLGCGSERALHYAEKAVRAGNERELAAAVGAALLLTRPQTSLTAVLDRAPAPTEASS